MTIENVTVNGKEQQVNTSYWYTDEEVVDYLGYRIVDLSKSSDYKLVKYSLNFGVQQYSDSFTYVFDPLQQGEKRGGGSQSLSSKLSDILCVTSNQVYDEEEKTTKTYEDTGTFAYRYKEAYNNAAFNKQKNFSIIVPIASDVHWSFIEINAKSVNGEIIIDCTHFDPTGSKAFPDQAEINLVMQKFGQNISAVTGEKFNGKVNFRSDNTQIQSERDGASCGILTAEMISCKVAKRPFIAKQPVGAVALRTQHLSYIDADPRGMKDFYQRQLKNEVNRNAYDRDAAFGASRVVHGANDLANPEPNRDTSTNRSPEEPDLNQRLSQQPAIARDINGSQIAPAPIDEAPINSQQRTNNFNIRRRHSEHNNLLLQAQRKIAADKFATSFLNLADNIDRLTANFKLEPWKDMVERENLLKAELVEIKAEIGRHSGLSISKSLNAGKLAEFNSKKSQIEAELKQVETERKEFEKDKSDNFPHIDPKGKSILEIRYYFEQMKDFISTAHGDFHDKHTIISNIDTTIKAIDEYQESMTNIQKIDNQLNALDQAYNSPSARL